MAEAHLTPLCIEQVTIDLLRALFTPDLHAPPGYRLTSLVDCAGIFCLLDNLYDGAMGVAASSASPPVRGRLTQRALYYSLPPLLRGGSYQHVLRLLDRVRQLVRSPSLAAMGVGTCARGFYVGPVRQAGSEGDGTTGIRCIPQTERSREASFEVASTVRYVLLVEKEAYARRLIDAFLTKGPADGVKHPTMPFVLICGRGYPCHATLAFAQAVRRAAPGVDFVALVDADPHGAQIMLNFMQCLLPSHPSHGLGQLNWLGLRPADAWSASLPSEPWNRRDEALCQSMIRRLRSLRADALSTESLIDDWIAQFDIMRAHHIKCELQAASTSVFLDNLFFTSRHSATAG